jgi:acyl dehydratase
LRAQVYGELPAGYDDVSPGHEFPPVDYVLDAEAVEAYVGAVGAAPRSYVPPLAVAARAIASLGNLMEMPAGTIHASQDFDFAALVPVGARVTCVAKVLRKLARGPMRMLTLEMIVSDEDGNVVQRGRSTVVLPEA